MSATPPSLVLLDSDTLDAQALLRARKSNPVAACAPVIVFISRGTQTCFDVLCLGVDACADAIDLLPILERFRGLLANRR